MPRPLSYSFTSFTSMTGNKFVDSLLADDHWYGPRWHEQGTPTMLTYSFAGTGSLFARDYSPSNEYENGYSLTGAQQSAVTSALGGWSAVANVQFSLVQETVVNVGDLRFGGYYGMDSKYAAWAYFPDTTPAGGDVWIGPSTNDPSPVKGSFDYLTFVHEIGHALGLKHPFDTTPDNKLVLDPSLDDVRFTVMSYNDSYSYQPTTPMLLDILAIQSLYGANTQWQAGNTVYSWAPTQSVFETIWDAGGNDTIDASNQLAAVRINLNEGQFSQIGKAFTDPNGDAFNEGLAIAYGAKIENAYGSAFDDSLIGNSLGNLLNGMAGADTMDGGAGNDNYVVDNTGDVVIERSTSISEIDTVYSFIDYTLGSNLENLTLLDGANLNGTGNALNNVITGNNGNNILDGGIGADYLAGGTGNDTYIVDNIRDVIVETSTLASEIDIVRSSATFTLSANLENLTLTGAANIDGIGNAQNNVITGNDGNNQLVGGAGLDTLIGGKGNDDYGLDQAGELALVQENANEGTDTLYITYAATAQTSTVDLNLSNLHNVENVLLLGTGAFTVLGNDLNNTLTGNSADNVLNGGLGADLMIGGAGNDTYVVDNLGDVIIETSALASGIDTVSSSLDYTLGSNLENLTLLGAANLNGTGNALNNVIIGNTGNNILDGGIGADTLAGGTGNDTYIVDDTRDVIVETSTLVGEIDTVRSSATFTLSNNLENLTLTGAANIDGIGNASDNVITGNDGNNQLVGGAGLDTLIGGKGNDDYGLDQAGELALVQENANEGTDTLYVLYNATAQADVVDLNLSNLQNVENVLLLGTGAFTALGNDLNNTLTGNSADNVLNGGLGADLMIGGAGNDTYVVDNLGDVISETSTLASEIDTVRSAVTFTLGANLENLTLTGSANIDGIGNAQNNVITGNDGNNQLVGGAGLDTLIGGKGNDDYGLDQAGELALVQENANEGTDTLYITYAATAQTSTVDLNLSNLQNVENVLLLGTSAFTALGNGLNNTLTGNSADNVLNGGLGADLMIGGAGNDTYVVDNLGDVINETSTLASEIDTVSSSLDYTLGSNLENLTLLGAANLNGTGNALNNVIIGNTGNNILDGGIGADYMAGGTGNDTYIVDNIRDVVVESSTLASEIDTVRSSVSYTLGNNLENLTLTGAANIDGIGNAQNNVITGNDGNNQLVGGAGLDTLIGGKGNDDYGLDQAGELALVQENINEGTDTLYVLYNATAQADVVDLNLSNLQNVENVLLLGTGAFTALGNDLNNTLTGNSADNVLNGGLGADLMIGGAGNDTYVVDNLGDAIIETSALASEIDTVSSSLDYTLGSNLENLTLLGAANLNGTGNALNNVIIGNTGNNILDGGIGADYLAGGTGNDTYIVDNIRDVIVETSTLASEIDTVRSSVTFTLGANLENLTLTGAANIDGIGNASDNVITGNDGNNQLVGGAGLDTLIGGKGNDDYGLDQAGELALVQENANEGTDTLYVIYNATAQTDVVDLNLSNLQNVENVLLLGTGAFTALGNDLNNTLTGNSADNVLNGGLGADLMIGGAGNDTYVVDNLGDVISETSTLASEIDTVRSAVTFTLGANLENLTLAGSANIDGIGNAQNNVITGNDGNNQLVGGAGLDTLIGGKGNDDYGLDQAGELALVQENANEGTDTLYITYAATVQATGLPSTVDLNLSNLHNVENVLLLGAGAFTVLGNDLNNTLTGNSADNVLDGSLGADLMIGGAGNDSYSVDNLGDVVVETSTLASEIDTVYSLIDYTLGNNVENLNLVGSTNLNGTGNALNNVINGYIGDNILDGGIGADYLAGGTGNDTYIVDNIRDVVVESSTLASEIDTVRSSVTFTLGANLENLALTGAANIDGIGNALDNVITGNDGNNQLVGGAGLDTLIGGKGNDDYGLDQAGELALIQENANEGTDTLYVLYNATAQTNTVDLNLSNLHNVENVLLLGTGAFTAQGNDLNNTLTGNANNNVLDGGLGADILTGGAGADKFVFSAVNEMGTGANRDVITDFNSLQGDKIDLTKFDANLLSAGFNGFSFIGANDFTGAGQLRFVDHVLYGNVNGDLGSDFEIQLVGVNTFGANDLVA
ncbi:M10 family metallopeptidase C-terminal domain-containing protein [Pseudomonas sp. CT11-2]|uniref:M10 family metallopeptidase C-terminal domain-containing protein n=1 Tax=Pseudomonas sp. CT11-2 TaxID=3243023 RepID=UPI0039AF691B